MALQAAKISLEGETHLAEFLIMSSQVAAILMCLRDSDLCSVLQCLCNATRFAGAASSAEILISQTCQSSMQKPADSTLDSRSKSIMKLRRRILPGNVSPARDQEHF